MRGTAALCIHGAHSLRIRTTGVIAAVSSRSHGNFENGHTQQTAEDTQLRSHAGADAETRREKPMATGIDRKQQTSPAATVSADAAGNTPVEISPENALVDRY